MFTGIVEELGTLAGIDRLDRAARLTLKGPRVAADAAHGDSIAVNGVCLTVVSVEDADAFTADVMAETLARSALGGLEPGDPVNLERAATLSTRLGGHLVQGHVDGVGTVLERRPDNELFSTSGPPQGAATTGKAGRKEFANWEIVRIALPPALGRYVVEKGSIAVDGVSLTVTAVTAEYFEVSLIPTTLAATTLGTRGVGAPVNLEVDVVAKYVEKLLVPSLEEQS
ncbi:riboflavin synthase [Cryptosporangium minutisporangium]|uniref:Riboflavin synthase n=1 Tax=Cryptosporangium minutisporangium TaxID=113569 RepID=A0ABP6SR21_9ACTN